jgi:hypothetical protein
MLVPVGVVRGFERDPGNAPLCVGLLELFYFDKLIWQDIIELLARAARGPRDFEGSNSRRLYEGRHVGRLR